MKLTFNLAEIEAGQKIFTPIDYTYPFPLCYSSKNGITVQRMEEKYNFKDLATAMSRLKDGGEWIVSIQIFGTSNRVMVGTITTKDTDIACGAYDAENYVQLGDSLNNYPVLSKSLEINESLLHGFIFKGKRYQLGMGEDDIFVLDEDGNEITAVEARDYLYFNYGSPCVEWERIACDIIYEL